MQLKLLEIIREITQYARKLGYGVFLYGVYFCCYCIRKGVRFVICACWIEDGGCGASLVAQWLRIRLPVQGTRV